LNAERTPLRVGVVLADRVVPRWLAALLERLEEATFVDLVRVVVASEREPGRTKLAATAFSAYERLDRRVFRVRSDGFEPTDVSDVVASKTAEEELDVVVNLAWPAGLDASSRPRFGEWSVHHGGPRAWHSDPPFFWETYYKEPVAITELCAQRPGEDVAHVIYRTVSATDLHSLYRARNRTCWKVGAAVTLRLAQLHERGWSFFESLPTYSELRSKSVPIQDEVPGNLRLAGHLARLAARLLHGRIRKQLSDEEWFLAYRRGSWPLDSDRGSFIHLASPPGRHFADPFVFDVDGRHYIFFEDLRLSEGRGVISFVEIREDGSTTPPTVALERDYHLSYPFVFAHAGEVFMLPESSANGTIELYRAEPFPHRWALDRVLMDDVRAVDATLVQHRGRWWLFANMREHGTEFSDELFLFSSPSLDGGWTPHPLNPIVSDVGRARPAGRIFSHEGGLIRPGQDSSRAYGSAVVFNRIDELSETDYRETPISRLEPDWSPGNLGTHTYSFDGVYEAVDGRRRRFKLVRRAPKTPSPAGPEAHRT
jgi:hypothetical protein